MPSLSLGLNTALSAIEAQQQVIDTASQNVANASTPGYNREEAVLAPTPGYAPPAMDQPWGAGQTGTGVEVSAINRVYNAFLDAQYRTTNAAVGQYNMTQTTLNQVETLFNEPGGNGLSTTLNTFWQAWQTLANDPADPATRQALVSDAQAVAQGFNNLSSQLFATRQNLNQLVSNDVSQVNSLASQIAALNQQIDAASAGAQAPNVQLDQRDHLIDQLSQYVNVTTYPQGNGVVNVYVGGVPLVQGNVASGITATADPANNGFYALTWQNTTLTASPQSGELYALLDLRDNVIPGYTSTLDSVASGLAAVVNGQPPANPAAAPTVGATSVTGGSLAAGTYEVGYTYTNASGETESSPLATVTLGTGQNAITVGALTPLPAGATQVNYYLSQTGATPVALDVSGASGAATTLTAEPATGAAAPPTSNTAGWGHEAGYGLDGSTDLPFFTSTTGTPTITASSLEVNPVVAGDLNKVAAASFSGESADGSNALAISGQQQAAAVGTSTVNQAYDSLVTQIGADAQTAGQFSQNEQALLTGIQTQQQSYSGVNSNQEAITLVQAENAYTAATKVVTTIQQMLQSLTSMVS
jgi:flagellar hook-associated protein 1 FlgK